MEVAQPVDHPLPGTDNQLDITEQNSAYNTSSQRHKFAAINTIGHQ